MDGGKEMICPNCSTPDNSKIIDCRSLLSLNIKRRRRLCKYCEHKFTTYELPVTEFHKKKSMLRGIAAINRIGHWELKYVNK